MAACVVGVCLVLIAAIGAEGANTASDEAYQKDLFAGRTVLRIQLEIPPAGIGELSRHEGTQS